MSREEELVEKIAELETEAEPLRSLTRWDYFNIAQHGKRETHIANMKAKGIWPQDLESL